MIQLFVTKEPLNIYINTLYWIIPIYILPFQLIFKWFMDVLVDWGKWEDGCDCSSCSSLISVDILQDDIQIQNTLNFNKEGYFDNAISNNFNWSSSYYYSSFERDDMDRVLWREMNDRGR